MSGELVNLHSSTFSVASKHRCEQLIRCELNFRVIGSSFLFCVGLNGKAVDIGDDLQGLVDRSMISLPCDDFAKFVDDRPTVALGVLDILQQSVLNLHRGHGCGVHDLILNPIAELLHSFVDFGVIRQQAARRGAWAAVIREHDGICPRCTHS